MTRNFNQNGLTRDLSDRIVGDKSEKFSVIQALNQFPDLYRIYTSKAPSWIGHPGQFITSQINSFQNYWEIWLLWETGDLFSMWSFPQRLPNCLEISYSCKIDCWGVLTFYSRVIVTVMRSEIQPDQRLIRRLGELSENIIESVNDEKETDAAWEIR